ncbi:MAG: APC family permease, partial [Candidatus Acidiferrales bacterium]
MSDVESVKSGTAPAEVQPAGFVRGLGLFDSTTIVVGSMIGSGIFIVSSDIGRHVGSTGGLLAAWIISGLMTVAAALSYGELAAMMPKAGGQYVYLREAYSPLWGFLYGWTLFLVIQTGTIAAVAVGFARYLGVIWPAISPNTWIIPPLSISSSYAISLSVQQVVALFIVAFLTLLNTFGLRLGKLIQNVFTSAKTLGLIGLIVAGVFFSRNAAAIHANFSNLWTIHDPQTIEPGAGWMKSFLPSVTAASGVFGLIVAFGVAQVGSLFSADAWNNITFTAGEVKNPRRDIPISLAAGTAVVITLYFLANLGYLSALTMHQIQTAPDDRVATATLGVIFGNAGATLMALAIMVSTFGCANGLILAGARVYYAMSRDGLFFRGIGRLNANHVPAMGLVLQGVWTGILVLLRTRLVDSATVAVSYGNLYSVLLDYVIFAALVFYVLTIGAVFV